MDPAHIELFDLADRKLSWIDRRQQVLAADVANADTPGWRSHDLKPFAAILGSVPVAPVRTNAAHLAGTSASATSITQDSSRAPDGNAVSLDSTLAKIADTDASHELVSDLYRKYLGLFRTALGR